MSKHEKMPSSEETEVSTPEIAAPEKSPGQVLAVKILEDIDLLQAGRTLETLDKKELKALRDKYLQIKQALGLEQGSAEGTAIEKAREIMRERLYGKEEIENALGFEVAESEIPSIPYSIETLEQAKVLGESLILRISHDGEGNLMTMERINEIMKPIMDKETEGKLLYEVNWYRDEDFYKKDSLKTEWKLVGGSFVTDMSSKKDKEEEHAEDSTNNNYIHQTRLLRDYLQSLGSLTKAEAAECSDEVLNQFSQEMGVDWDSQKITDSAKYDKNWREVARKLSALQVNKNHRRSPKEMIYDWVLQFKKSKDRGPLEINYDWSAVLSSGGSLVFVGRADAAGALVSGYGPGYRVGNLGVVSLR